ncbi:MAG: DsrE family protein [Lamprobacter sp.]|uniref:DsrE family protein n=1 Tax=Lamprobacter sp. TaxID=3100796 RepID=UPI002B25C3AE|nr:DsrE family protein [Lamprobacter sp.]MEA3639326.1 DsrE family protein [Lamprobacter sp.]
MPQTLRNFLLGLGLLALTTTALATDDKLNVVYHLSDEDKVSFALNNIQNHIDGIGGPEKINIILVSHGSAVNRFTDIEAVNKVRENVAKLQEQGVTFEACANTLSVFNLEPDELLPGFVLAEQGGVTRIAELQSKGYVYLRP